MHSKLLQDSEAEKRDGDEEGEERTFIPFSHLYDQMKQFKIARAKVN